jgi:hypothetical protein
MSMMPIETEFASVVLYVPFKAALRIQLAQMPQPCLRVLIMLVLYEKQSAGANAATLPKGAEYACAVCII